VQEIDTSKAHPARIYDFLLSGTDHFEADREAIAGLLKALPNARTGAREKRAFLAARCGSSSPRRGSGSSSTSGPEPRVRCPPRSPTTGQSAVSRGAVRPVHDIRNPWANPVTWAVPFFVLFIGIELAALKWLDHADVAGYQTRDATTSILMGLGSLATTLALKAAAFFVYVALYLYVAPWHLPTRTWWSWVLIIAGVDLAYYWQHRFVHRARVGWAAHQAHHSSQYLNFATALRQKWNPWFDFFFWLPLPLLGVPPWAIYFGYGINLVYQFFVHTETVARLPRPVEFVFNTPSHHRVHHGSDAIYLDKNYGGILILWDRLFGTFQQELFRPTYGLVHQVDTYNLVSLQYGHYAALWHDVRDAAGWRDRLGYLFMPPDWQPAAVAAGPRVPTAR
jgi:sterol desaturase/sphingolipid hydroxylase (fatty acid hydroxylase superfamily)